MHGSLVELMVVAFLGVIALVAVAAFSQMADPAQDVELKLDHIAPPPVSSEAKQPRPHKNSVRLSSLDDAREIAIGEILKFQPTPPIRATFFQSILKRDDFHLAGWDLKVLEVKTENDITRFKVSARPVMDGPMLIFDALDETYQLEGDKLKLLITNPPVDPAVVKEFGFALW